MNLEPILQAVRLSAILCRDVQDHYLARSDKGVNDPVTIADYGSQAIISRMISQKFPGDAVLAEERGDQFLTLVPEEGRAQIFALLSNLLETEVTEADVLAWLDYGRDVQAARTWIIDPIDGTKGFLARRQYAIGVGILEEGALTGAVIGAPGYHEKGAHGGLFYAQGGRAYCEPLAGGVPELIHVSTREDPAALRIVQSFEKAHASKERMGRVRDLAGMGAARVDELDSMEKYAQVACADADLYLRLPRADNTYGHKAWDHAAGTALVLAAGGMVTDLDGSPLDFTRGPALPNLGMVVSNGRIHERVLTAVQQVMSQN